MWIALRVVRTGIRWTRVRTDCATYAGVADASATPSNSGFRRVKTSTRPVASSTRAISGGVVIDCRTQAAHP